MNEPPADPVLPVLEVLARPCSGERRQVIRLAHNEFRDGIGRCTHRGDPACPVEPWGLGGQVGERAQVVGQVGVAAFDDIPVRGGQLGFQRDDARGRLGVVAAVDEGEHRGDVLRIGGENFGVLLVAVVGLVGQAQPGLAQVHQIARRVLGVGIDVHTGAATDPGTLQSADNRGQRVGVLGGVDRGQLVEQRLHTALCHRGLVHEAGVQVADALLVGVLLRARRRCLGDQVTDLLLGTIVERPERAVGRAVGRDLVLGQPATVDMAEQIVLGAGIRVDVGEIDTGANGFYRHSNILPEPAGTLSAVPDEPTEDRETTTGPVFTGFGIGSAVLGVLAVAAVVLAGLIWTQHRSDVDELHYRTRVMQAAADWTSVLINMNKDSVEANLNQLHEGTVGQLNADFDSTVEPYRKLVQTLQARTTGQIDSVAVESIHHAQPGPNGAPPPKPQPELSASASRTDTVMVVATSISETAGADKPQTVRWTLRLDVSDVDGKLLISRLEPIR